MRHHLHYPFPDKSSPSLPKAQVHFLPPQPVSRKMHPPLTKHWNHSITPTSSWPSTWRFLTLQEPYGDSLRRATVTQAWHVFHTISLCLYSSWTSSANFLRLHTSAEVTWLRRDTSYIQRSTSFGLRPVPPPLSLSVSIPSHTETLAQQLYETCLVSRVAVTEHNWNFIEAVKSNLPLLAALPFKIAHKTYLVPQLDIIIDFRDGFAVDSYVTTVRILCVPTFFSRINFESDIQAGSTEPFHFGLQFLKVLGKDNTVLVNRSNSNKRIGHSLLRE